jgi:hypothetical protein
VVAVLVNLVDVSLADFVFGRERVRVNHNADFKGEIEKVDPLAGARRLLMAGCLLLAYGHRWNDFVSGTRAGLTGLTRGRLCADGLAVTEFFLGRGMVLRSSASQMDGGMTILMMVVVIVTRWNGRERGCF